MTTTEDEDAVDLFGFDENINDSGVSQLNRSERYNFMGITFTIWFSVCLSVFGSSAIIYLILRQRKWKQGIFNRMMLGASILDICYSSVGVMGQSFLLPKDAFNGLSPLARGNQITCNVGGFFLFFLQGTSVYSFCLSFYFMATIIYQWKEMKANRIFEPWVHVFAFGLPIVTGCVSIALKIFNPHPLFGLCAYSTFPRSCTGDNCERGNPTVVISAVLINAILTALSGLLTVVCIWKVVFHVRKQRRRMQDRYEFGNQTRSTRKDKRVQAVSSQAIFYTLSFGYTAFITFGNLLFRIAYTSLKAVPEDNRGQAEDPVFVVATYIVGFLNPLQGFFNAVVFTRPMVLRWKEANPNKSWLWAICMVLSAKTMPLVNRSLPAKESKMRVTATTKTSSRREASSLRTTGNENVLQGHTEVSGSLVKGFASGGEAERPNVMFSYEFNCDDFEERTSGEVVNENIGVAEDDEDTDTVDVEGKVTSRRKSQQEFRKSVQLFLNNDDKAALSLPTHEPQRRQHRHRSRSLRSSFVNMFRTSGKSAKAEDIAAEQLHENESSHEGDAHEEVTDNTPTMENDSSLSLRPEIRGNRSSRPSRLAFLHGNEDLDMESTEKLDKKSNGEEEGDFDDESHSDFDDMVEEDDPLKHLQMIFNQV